MPAILTPSLAALLHLMSPLSHLILPSKLPFERGGVGGVSGTYKVLYNRVTSVLRGTVMYVQVVMHFCTTVPGTVCT